MYMQPLKYHCGQGSLMKRIVSYSVLLMVVMSSVLSAETFSPAILTIIAPEVVEYDFNMQAMEIPIEISGTPAQIQFCVFTKDQASVIGPLTNGHLGWHYVNRIDTCVYYSRPQSLKTGTHSIIWDGRDNDRKFVTPGSYTYYIWGFDNQTFKQKATHFITPYNRSIPGVIEKDNDGLPLSNPILYTQRLRWPLGSPPMDESFLEIVDYPDTSSWKWIGTPAVINGLTDRFYIRVRNPQENRGAIAGYRWIPDGVPEPVIGFGAGGISVSFEDPPGLKPGVVTDGEYLYTTDGANTGVPYPDADFYMYDTSGLLVREIDLTEWWTATEVTSDNTAINVNFGPSYISERNGMVYISSHASCLQQMVNPVRYLESGNPDDFYVWANGNGDYIMDKNFTETSERPWLCNDDNTEVFYQLFADGNGFVHGGCTNIGAVSFGLMAPDGTGLWYCAFESDTAREKFGMFIIDGETAFDGIYSEELHRFDGHAESYVVIDGRKFMSRSTGAYFTAHDSFRGAIEPPEQWLILLSPSGKEIMTGGEPWEIRWISHGIDTVKIEWSYESDKWETIADRVDAATELYTWVVPVRNANGRIRITSLDTEPLSATSPDYFIIKPPSLTMSMPSPNAKYLDGKTIRIMWNYYGISTIRLDYSLDGGTTWENIASGIAADHNNVGPRVDIGNYVWDPPDIDAPDCRIRLTAEDKPEITFETNGVFSLVLNELRILLPHANSTWTANEEQRIMWESDSGIASVDIHYSTDDGLTWTLLAEDVPAAPEECYVTAPDNRTDACRISLTAVERGLTVRSRSFPLKGGTIVAHDIPASFSVESNTPNPFNAVTSIPFTIPASGAVKAEVFSLTGQRVDILADGILDQGRHLLIWNTAEYSAGIYFCRITWGNRSLTRKMLLVK